jgi:hypothetical protein
MADKRGIWFKRVFTAYYPINGYGWFAFLSVLLLIFVSYDVVSSANNDIHFIDDFYIPALILIPGVAIMLYICVKYSE